MEVLNFLMMSVVAPIHLEVPLSLESVLFLMVVHMDSSLVHHHLAQIPLSHELSAAVPYIESMTGSKSFSLLSGVPKTNLP